MICFAKQAGIAAIILLSVLGCTSIPTQEMSDARQALQAARNSGAAVHAPHKLEYAQSLMDEAAQALDAGRYAEARGKAIDAKSAALTASRQAEENQETH